MGGQIKSGSLIVCRLLAALVVLGIVATPSRGDDKQLDSLVRTLTEYRATPAAQLGEREAGPKLTVAKHQLREWVEIQLSTLAHSAENPAGDVEKFTERLNAKLGAADLFCDSKIDPKGERCVPKTEREDFNGRGFLGGIRLSRQQEDRYLVLTTSAGIACGYDDSAYVYEWRNRRWQSLLETEQNTYTEKSYNPQNIDAVWISPAKVAWNEPAPPPLILTLGVYPWCSSNWQAVYYRLWRAKVDGSQPTLLLDKNDSIYIGNHQPPVMGSLGLNDALIEYQSYGIDASWRTVVAHYQIMNGDRIERIAPVAPNPTDFVEEWISRSWSESDQWVESSKRQALHAWHETLHKNALLGLFAEPSGAGRNDLTLWQVGIAQVKDQKTFDPGEPAYFSVRWLPPYRFTLLDISDTPRAGCGQKIEMPDNFGTMFPLQDWRE